MNINWSEIMIAIVGLIGTILTYVIVPYIKSKTTKEQREDAYNFAKICVAAAEQMKNAGILNIPKREYVINCLKAENPDLTDEQIDTFLEAAVKELNIALEEIKK